MNSNRLNKIAIAAIAAGFLLWGYGFAHEVFFSTGTIRSLLDPLRLAVIRGTGRPIPPGFLEECLGIILAAAGLLFKIRLGKG